MARNKKIKITLSESSINNAIQQISNYRQNIIAKTDALVKRLTELGMENIHTTMMSIAPVDRGEYDVDYVYNESGDAIKGAIIYLTGDQVLFLEFSAGKLFGTKSFQPLPNNTSYGSGYGMGTYPGKGHWDDPTGWWYVDKYGEAQHTYGVRAHAPMYKADQKMREALSAEASAIFGG